MKVLKKVFKFSNSYTACYLFAFSLFSTGCKIGSYTEGTFYRIQSRPLSLNMPDLRTCIFDPHNSIVHFPMYHYPPKGDYTPEEKERIFRSQFQLMHTILDYSRSSYKLSVFDEYINSDIYFPNYYQALVTGQASADNFERIDGVKFNKQSVMKTAEHLFPSFPSHYEYLSQEQKELLFFPGASLLLYLLNEIPQIHKVITPEKWNLVKSNVFQSGIFNPGGNDYWIFDFRDLALKEEVVSFFQQNHSTNRLIFIAYGARHDFSDEFAGFPFQSGHNFCLNWLNSSL